MSQVSFDVLPVHLARHAARWSALWASDAAKWCPSWPEPVSPGAPAESCGRWTWSSLAPPQSSCSAICVAQRHIIRREIKEAILSMLKFNFENRGWRIKLCSENLSSCMMSSAHRDRSIFSAAVTNSLKSTQLCFEVLALDIPLTQTLQVGSQRALAFSHLLPRKLVFQL